MPKFLFAYHGAPGADFDGQAHMAKWREWSAANKGAMVDPGDAVSKSYTVSSGGMSEDGGSNPLSGYTVFEAETLEAACKIASSCPHLDFGTIEVAQMMGMEM